MLEQIKAFFNNYLIMCAIVAWFGAQMCKVFTGMFKERKFDIITLFFSSGGMPSSHSSTVCALATSSGLIYGLNSFEFAVTTMLAIIVMYDAMGVRRETGIQAKIINEMMDIFNSMNKKVSAEDKLKELVGHTPLQVLAGAILGIVIAFIIINI